MAGPQWDGPMDAAFAARAYSAGKGVPMTEDALLEVAKRIRNLERAYMVREGLRKEDDKLSKRFFEPVPDGRYKGEKIDYAEMEEAKSEYYALWGWDTETGKPLPIKR